MRFSIELVRPKQAERLAHIRKYLAQHWRISEGEAEKRTALPSGAFFFAGFPRLWVATLSTGSVCGHAMLAREPAGFLGLRGRLWLQALFVDENMRHQGVGRALAREAEMAVMRSEYQGFYLCTIDQVGFYRDLGWQIVGTDHWQGRDAAVTVMYRQTFEPR